MLDADLTAELLETIFTPHAPLHDGAVIIRGDRVIAAGVVLPLSETGHLSRALWHAPSRGPGHHRADRRGRGRGQRGDGHDQPRRARPDRAQPRRGRAWRGLLDLLEHDALERHDQRSAHPAAPTRCGAAAIARRPARRRAAADRPPDGGAIAPRLGGARPLAPRLRPGRASRPHRTDGRPSEARDSTSCCATGRSSWERSCSPRSCTAASCWPRTCAPGPATCPIEVIRRRPAPPCSTDLRAGHPGPLPRAARRRRRVGPDSFRATVDLARRRAARRRAAGRRCRSR